MIDIKSKITEQTHAVVSEMLERGLDTVDYYFDVYEELSDERDDLHDEIIKKRPGE
jgi:hypothetical protein